MNWSASPDKRTRELYYSRCSRLKAAHDCSAFDRLGGRLSIKIVSHRCKEIHKMPKTLLLSLGLLALTACGPEYSSDAECLVKERQEGFEGSTGALLQFCSEDQRKETLAERLQNRS